MKKTIFTILVFIIVFLIYSLNINEKIYYVSIGDYLSYGINNFGNVNNSYSINIKNKSNIENYINYSNIEDYRVMDLINDINYNKIINYNGKEYKMQNLLIKANLMTISIGMNDLIYKKNITYQYLDELLNDIDDLFILIRKYNKDKIYFLSFYDIIDNKQYINYMNNNLQKICKKNKVIYVDITNLNNYILDGIYPTNDGYTYITDKILKLY